MSRLLATAKTRFFIGAAKRYPGRTMVAADFGAAGWTRILGTTNLGRSGDASELITSNQIDSGGDARTRKAKGTKNAGTMEIVADLDMSDAGQIALVAAETSEESFAFKIEFTDGSIRYFVALVMSAGEQYDEANSIMKLNATLELGSNVVRVAATEGA